MNVTTEELPCGRELTRLILMRPDALAASECERLIEIHRTFWPRKRVDHGGNHVLFGPDLRDYEPDGSQLSFVRRLAAAITDEVEHFFQDDRIHLESVFIAAMIQGARQELHADNEKYAEAGWVPNHSPDRDYTAIVYLNSDFGGGGLCFPQHRLCLKPEMGLLVAFPSTRYFVHEVHRVSAGTRYSMPLWFTHDSSRAVW